MDKLEAMRRFMLVARTGSFTQAAEEAGLPKSSMSQAVQNLEKHLGSRLFNRSTRSLSLTSDGQAFFPECEAILAEVDSLEGRFQARHKQLRGDLRVDMPARFATTMVIPHLNDWFSRYPLINLKISSADYRVDLIKEGIDCVVRVGDLTNSDLVARPLTRYRLVNCVSQAYADNFGTPKNVSELQHHHLIDYSPGRGSGNAHFEYEEQGECKTVRVPTRLAVGGTEAYLAACLAGQGIAQLPAIGVISQLRAGQLIRVLKQAEPLAMPVNLLYASRRQRSPRINAFGDWLLQVIREEEASLPDDCRA